LKRLRLTSIDSIEADPELMDVIAGEERVMPHIHLSLQSGDNMILKRMKRRHAREDSIAFCAELRARRPGIVFGADIIAGFPTETDGMFANSLKIVDDCGLTYLHVFPFSPGPARRQNACRSWRRASSRNVQPCSAGRVKSGSMTFSAGRSAPRARFWSRRRPWAARSISPR
jgi:tRNA A37 methylthiotransferase MiaB